MLFQQALYMVLFFSLFPCPKLLSVFILTKTLEDGEQRVSPCPISVLSCCCCHLCYRFCCYNQVIIPYLEILKMANRLTQSHRHKHKHGRSQINSWHPSGPANSCRSTKLSTEASEVTPDYLSSSTPQSPNPHL